MISSALNSLAPALLIIRRMNEQAETVAETTDDQTTFVLIRAINALELGMAEAAYRMLLDELRRRLANCTGRPVVQTQNCVP